MEGESDRCMKKEEIPEEFRSDLLAFERMLESKGFRGLDLPAGTGSKDTITNLVNYLERAKGDITWAELKNNPVARKDIFPLDMYTSFYENKPGRILTDHTLQIDYATNNRFHVNKLCMLRIHPGHNVFEVTVALKNCTLPSIKKLNAYLDKEDQNRRLNKKEVVYKTIDSRVLIGRGNRIR